MRRRRRAGKGATMRWVERLRCCGRWAYWRMEPGSGSAWAVFCGHWACTVCERRIEGPPPRYVVDALAAALRDLPPPTAAELREMAAVFGFEVAAR